MLTTIVVGLGLVLFLAVAVLMLALAVLLMQAPMRRVVRLVMRPLIQQLERRGVVREGEQQVAGRPF